MEKFGFLAIILVWGGLLYVLFTSGPVGAAFGGASFLSSFIGDFNNNSQVQENAIVLMDGGGNLEKAQVHFNTAVNIFDVAIGSLAFAGSNHGLFISRDGGLNWYNFSDIEKKINSDSQVYKILFNPAKPSEAFISVFSGNKGVIYKSSDKFFSLDKIFEITSEAVYDFDIYGENLYLGLSNGRLIICSLTKNQSRVLTSFNSPISQLKVFGDSGLVYLTLKSGGFWVSKNFGESFEQTTFLNNYSGANKIHNFEASALNNSLIYASTDYGLIRSSDKGASWQVFKSLPTEKRSISAVFFKPNPGEIFAACNGKIYASLDYGLNWKITDAEINNIISVIEPIGDKIIVGTKQ